LTIDALIDSNVLIALLAEAHEHHGPSLSLLIDGRASQFAVAAHSYAEAYNTLTRRGERAPFRFTPEEAWAALESVRAVTSLIGLTAPQTFDAVRSYAQGGWIGHMRSLFPKLTITTPSDFIVGK
jgi:predicted nucleic acid-binding protein